MCTHATTLGARAESSSHSSALLEAPYGPEGPDLYHPIEVPHFISLRKRESSNLEEAEWSNHRAQIIRLYWQEIRSTRQVQVIMKQEHGFDKS